MDCRSIFRTDMGICIGVRFRLLLKSFSDPDPFGLLDILTRAHMMNTEVFQSYRWWPFDDYRLLRSGILVSQSRCDLLRFLGEHACR